MSDRERMKEIVRREFHRTRLLQAYPVDRIVDRLIAAGFGDVAAARREALEECEQHFRDRASGAGEDGNWHEVRIYNAAANEVATLMDQPTTDWRALAEKLAGALACLNARFEDDLQGRTYTLRDKVNAVTKAREALAAAYKAGINGEG